MGSARFQCPAEGLAPAELAGAVVRALTLPEVTALRPGLTPEFPLYASAMMDGHEEATAGVADAVAFDPGGKPRVVVDWKSDVAPSADIIEHYRAQVRAYLDVTETERGLIVLVTPGAVIQVMRMAAPAAS